MKALFKRHVSYPKSSLVAHPSYAYSHNCQCNTAKLVQRKIKLCLEVNIRKRLLECYICRTIFQATVDEIKLYRLHYRKLAYHQEKEPQGTLQDAHAKATAIALDDIERQAREIATTTELKIYLHTSPMDCQDWEEPS